MKFSASDSSCVSSCIRHVNKGLLNLLITKGNKHSVCVCVLVWAITGHECLPGGNLFGIVVLFICSVLGGKLVGMIQLPTLPPLPSSTWYDPAAQTLQLYLTYLITFIFTHWTHFKDSLRNIALSIILTRAGLGLDPTALRRLKAVCVRLAVGPCVLEASVVAVVSHFLLGLPWIWGFIQG
uniref:Uncharacterized protein n=1 Tax=Sander lucioperca TaxID=283035 RepID=A0A8C9ZF77_SANLU